MIHRNVTDLLYFILLLYRKIFWTDNEHCSARIATANMDGSDKQVVYQLNDDYEECINSCVRQYSCLRRLANQMELNYTSNELYWVDGNQDIVESVGIDGSNYRIVQNATFAFGLGLDINDVYITLWKGHNNTLWKWYNSPSSSLQLLRDSIIGLAMDVAVVRRSKRPAGNTL